MCVISDIKSDTHHVSEAVIHIMIQEELQHPDPGNHREIRGHTDTVQS